jgi:hypothetical protein
MRNALVALAAFAILAAPAASRAEEGAAEHGLQLKLGLGLGYGIPMGDVVKDEKLSDLYGGEIPVELEASYRFTHAISAGVYVGYGLGLVSSKEVNGEKASDFIDSIASWRFGVQGEYEFAKVGPALPFAALRVGYVTESIGLKGGETMKASGWEYLTLIGGADFEVAKSFGVGPFVSFSLGQYTTEKVPGGSSESIPSDERAMHEWLTIGVRGSFAL